MLRDTIEFLLERLACAERRLKAAHLRPPYSLAERLHILWCVEYFGIPRRQIPKHFGVARSTVWRWLRRIQEGVGLCGRQCQLSLRRTSEELERLIWQIRDCNPQWGRRRIGLVLGTLGIFLAASTVRNILLRPKPRPEGTPAAAPGTPEEKKLRQIVARYPNHVWSADRTRVWRWRAWPTYSNPVKPYSARFLTLEAVCLPADAPTQAPPRERSSLPPLVAATPPALPRGNPTLARSDRGADSRNLPSSTIAETRRQRRMLGEKVTLPAAPLAR
jgi:transposase